MRAPPQGAVPLSAVTRWAQVSHAPLTDYKGKAPPLHAYPVFPYDDVINNRFAIWQGDISTLEVDAVTNTSDETLTECNAVSERIMAAAGPDLKEEIITRAHECRTGEVLVTPGFMLRCRHVIHTVSPKYVAKYHTAAESSLHNCYKNVLHAAGDLRARSLALCVINTPRRNFPPDVAAHVALRTIRRYLEANPLPTLVVLAGACGAELAPFAALAPLYFPRAAGEADAARWALRPHADPPERRIRIIHNPHSHSAPGECCMSFQQPHQLSNYPRSTLPACSTARCTSRTARPAVATCYAARRSSHPTTLRAMQHTTPFRTPCTYSVLYRTPHVVPRVFRTPHVPRAGQINARRAAIKKN
ncbi:unnamed protein product [Colias eurytheme]|nr:unnamed protein product [Colias eurytheme]